MAPRSTRSTPTSAARVATLPKAQRPRTRAATVAAARMLPALREQTAVTTLLPDGPDVLPVSQELRRSLIAERAYHLAAERNFAPGREMDDWLAAEAEIDRTLRHA